jgi:hypothetical protein
VTVNDIRDITSFKWATVTGTNPLAIKLDGDTAPLALIPDSLVDPLSLAPGDRVRVELSLRKVVVHGVSKGGLAGGTTTARNNRFGIPTTDAERVALANRKVVWFNTDNGWEESYYATTGLSGLIAKGLLAGYASGWYPTGNGITPQITMDPTATAAGATGNYLAGWNGTVRRVGGDDVFVFDQYGPTLKLPGYYDLSCYSVQPAGTGLADFHIRLTNIADTVVEWQSNLSGIALSTSYFTAINGNFKSTLIKPGGNLFRWFVSNGSLTMHNTSGPAGSGRGQMAARYIRPPLVTD